MIEMPDLVLSRYVDTTLFGDRPHIRGRRIPIAVIAHNALSRQLNIEQISYEFGISASESLAALLYYQENRDEIEQQEQIEQALMDAIYQEKGGLRGNR
jgi:uncharacterized protein (DUF433 family)